MSTSPFRSGLDDEALAVRKREVAGRHAGAGRGARRECHRLTAARDARHQVRQRRRDEERAECDAEAGEAGERESRAADERAGQVAHLRRDGAHDADLAPEVSGHGESVDGPGDGSRRHRHRREGEQRERHGDAGRDPPHEADGDGGGDAAGEHRPSGGALREPSRALGADEIRNRNDAERKSRARGREAVLPGEERAAVDERARPCRIRHQLTDGPATPLWQPEKPAQRRPFAAERGVRGARGDGQQRDERGGQRQREEREAPVHLRDEADEWHPGDPGSGRTGQSPGHDAGALLGSAPRGHPGDPCREQRRDPGPHRYLGDREQRERRRGRACDGAEGKERASHAEERAGRVADEGASGEERDDSCERRGDDPKLPGRGDRDPEIVGHVAQDRRQHEHARLAREEREEEDERRRRAHAEPARSRGRRRHEDRDRFGHARSIRDAGRQRDAAGTSRACGKPNRADYTRRP